MGLLRRIYPRERPFAHGAMPPLVPHRPGASFPSRHVASAFALAVPAWEAHRGIGGAMLMVAVVMAASRVYSGLHYLSDVVGGALVGAVCAALAPGRLQR